MTLSATAATLMIVLAAFQQEATDHQLVSFHDERAKVAISYPASFKLKTMPEKEAVVAQTNGKMKTQQPDSTLSIASDNLPFVATTPPGAPFAMVQFSRFDGKSINIPSVKAGLRDMAAGIMKPLVQRLLDPNVGSVISLPMGDHNGVALFGSGHLQSNKAKSMYVAIICFSSSGQDGCLTEVAFDKADVIELLHNSIQFDGESSHPLVEIPIDFNDSSSRVDN